MDKGATDHWDKCVVAQATLNDTLSYNRAADMPFLSPLENIELEKLRTLVCTIVEFHPSVVYLQRCLGDIPLHTGFPRHIPAALLIGSVQVFVGENLFVIIRISPPCALGFRSCCLAALVSQFMSLLTCHNGNRPLRMVDRMGCTNHLKSPGMKYRITHQPIPCKQRPPGLIEVYIYLLRKVMSSFSPSQPDFTTGVTLSAKKKPNPGEEPNATPFELFALFEFELPLLFTLQKLVEEDANGERNHQFAALRFTEHNL